MEMDDNRRDRLDGFEGAYNVGGLHAVGGTGNALVLQEGEIKQYGIPWL
jgi:hypothetical protein